MLIKRYTIKNIIELYIYDLKGDSKSLNRKDKPTILVDHPLHPGKLQIEYWENDKFLYSHLINKQ